MLSSAAARIREDRPQLGAMRTRALAAATGREARIAGDTHYGYGEFAAAAELYRAALQKGGEDANLLNLRLGASLARAGQRAPAEAAFRAVTGPRQPLAGYWLLWLERGTAGDRSAGAGDAHGSADPAHPAAIAVPFCDGRRSAASVAPRLKLRVA